MTHLVFSNALDDFEKIKQITPLIDFTKINHLVLSDLIYNVLDILIIYFRIKTV